jgi:hypothetical protein
MAKREIQSCRSLNSPTRRESAHFPCQREGTTESNKRSLWIFQVQPTTRHRPQDGRIPQTQSVDLSSPTYLLADHFYLVNHVNPVRVRSDLKNPQTAETV